MPILPYHYQVVERQKEQDELLTDLAVIGVPPLYRDRKPSSESYPDKFDQDCKPVWELMLYSDEYEAKIRGHSVDGAWHQAIQLFLSICADLGINPFSFTTDIPANEYVMYQAKKYRLHLVRYLNASGLFEHIQVRKSYREYTRTKDGLIISSWADMFPHPGVDRTHFEDYLTDIEGPRFLRYVDNHFVHVVIPPVQVWVKCINMMRIQVGFTLDIKGTVDIPGNKTPTRKEVDEWLDRVVWLPLLRAHKFRFVQNRLF